MAQKINITQFGGNYSTSEQKTGAKWVDGKTIYKKTINCGSMPNATTKNIAHGVAGITGIVNIEGRVTNGTSWWPLPVPASVVTGSYLRVSIDATNIILVTGIDWSAYSGYVTFYYTKT